MIRQRHPNSPYVKAVRPMEKADMEALRQPSSRVRIARISDTHHIIARLIVSGLSLAEIAEETGYSISRISVIKAAPAMQELIAKYRADDHDQWKEKRDNYYAYIESAGKKSWRKIIEKLDADDENETSEIPFRDLLKIADSSADRIGYHRKSTKENINIDFAARLEAAITRSNQTKFIEQKS